MPRPGTAAAGRWLRQRARLVVYRRSAPPATVTAAQAPSASGFAARLRCTGCGTKWSGPARPAADAVKWQGKTWRLVDRMRYPPLDDRDRTACRREGWRATAT